MNRGRPDPSLSPRAQRAREHLLETLRAGGSATRTELASRTGLAASSVAATATALLAAGVIVETAVERSGRGRRAGVLSVAPTGEAVVLGIDIGHRHVAVALADQDSTVLAQRRANFDVDHQATGTLDQAAELSHTVADECGVALDSVAAVAACLPTTLDSDAGDASWRGVTSVGEELGQRLGRPVDVVNDADAGLLGEVRFGAARGFRDVLYVKASHGIGAAYLLDGRPYRGSRGMSGEIGHIRVPSLVLGADAPWCRCGNQGCLETVVSSEVVDERLERAQASLGGSAKRLDLIERRIVSDAGQKLGRVLAALGAALDPALIVIGGDLAARTDATGSSPLIAGVRDAMAEYALPIIAASLEIRPSALGPEAELRGVLVSALEPVVRPT